MRLLKLDEHGEICLKSFDDESTLPCYSILSHTWSRNSEDEFLYDDVTLKKGQEKPGYQKVLFCMRQAAKDGLQYCWVDTCCIDKTNSTELNSAIVSMFRWYQKATKCYVYLSDLSFAGSTDEARYSRLMWETSLRQSRWFTRCWTLQELLAPSFVGFFSREEVYIGDKHLLENDIHEVTGIPVQALRGRNLSEYSVAERMKWASQRRCKLPEDKALCLCGIFGVTVPIVYGEGEDRAFNRLNQEIRNLSQLEHSEEDETDSGDSAWRLPPRKRRRLELNTSLDAEQVQILMDSLSFDEIEARWMTIKIAHRKTCRWLLKDPQYLEWLDSSKQRKHQGFLWIKGKPGSGKSTLMKFISDNVRRKKKDDVLLQFFFNARGAELEKSTAGTYRTLLLQLLRQMPSLRSCFNVLVHLAARIGSGYVWNTEALKMLLTEAFRNLGERSVICLIDALDECDEEEVRDMISFFESLCDQDDMQPGQLRICLASRHHPYITIRKGLSLTLEGKDGHEQDIMSYIVSELHIEHGQPADDIRHEILRKASRVFIWAVLVVGILNKEYDSGRLHLNQFEQRLAEIPENIHDLFRDILSRDSHKRDELVLCIQWVLFAKQPLTVRELYLAIHSTSKHKLISLSKEFEWVIERADIFVLDVSKGLTEVTRSKRNPTVQFIHESVRDFFLKHNGLNELGRNIMDLEGESHEQLKKCCVSYTDIDIVKRMFPILDGEIEQMPYEQRNDALPFLRYAVQNVLYHADQAAKIEDSQSKFVSEFDPAHWAHLSNLFENYHIRKYSASVSSLYIFAELNTPNLIKAHPDVLEYLSMEQEERYGTPLFAALAVGNAEAACAFLDAHVKVSSSLQPYLVMFKEAVREGHWQGQFRRTFYFSKKKGLLNHIVEFSGNAVFEFMIETPAFDQLVAVIGPGEVIERILQSIHERKLLDTGANIEANADTQDQADQLDNQASAHTQSSNISITENFQRWLLAILGKVAGVGVTIDLRNAVDYAALLKNERIIKMLVDEVVKNNAIVDFGTALGIASASGQNEIVQILIDGIDVAGVIMDFSTLIMAAFRKGYEQTVKILIEGANKTDASIDFNRAIIEALRCGNEQILEILFERAIKTRATFDFNSVIDGAYHTRHRRLLEVFIDKATKMDATLDCNYAISHIVSLGDKSLAEFLINRIVETGLVVDVNGVIVRCSQSERNLEVLIDRATDSDAVIDFQDTLDEAIQLGYERIAKNIINKAITAGTYIDFYRSIRLAATPPGSGSAGTVGTMTLLLDEAARAEVFTSFDNLIRYMIEHNPWLIDARSLQIIFDSAVSAGFRINISGAVKAVFDLLGDEGWIDQLLNAAKVCRVHVDFDDVITTASSFVQELFHKKEHIKRSQALILVTLREWRQPTFEGEKHYGCSFKNAMNLMRTLNNSIDIDKTLEEFWNSI